MLRIFFSRWQNVVDFVVLATAIYWLLLLGSKGHVLRIIIWTGGLAAFGSLAGQMGLPITAWVLNLAAIASLALLALVYYPQIRYALIHFDPLNRLLKSQPPGQTSDLTEIAEASFALATTRRGALIVLKGKRRLDHLLTGGIPLGGQISREILEAIFRKVSPVHDGAVVIEDGHISRVGVFLPLTRRADLPSHYGTRHRAAFGLAELSDAVVIVVSEERGEVSLVKGSNIRPIESTDDLVHQLRDFSGVAPLVSGRKLRHWLFGAWRLKLLSLVIASLIWTLLVAPGDTVRAFTIPIEFENVPAGLEVTQVSTGVIVAQLRASAWRYSGLDAGRLTVKIDLKGMTEGSHNVVVGSSDLDLPPGIHLEQVSPPTVEIRLARLQTARP
jgi:uncharacterized protein (TIGR00159 family)